MTPQDIHIKLRSSRAAREIAAWVAIGSILAVGVVYSWNPTPLAQALAAVFIGCALVHAGASYGSRRALALFIICLVITSAMENLGAATGFPFGHYHFVADAGLPRLGATPVIVGPLWFGAGYFSWVVASILLDDADRRLDRTFEFLALPVVAAFVMTQWDVVMDRAESTLAHAWIWQDGGADFGVPLTNYLGWLLTAWLLFQAFAICLRRQRPDSLRAAPLARKLQMIAILFYVSLGLTHLIPWWMGQSGAVLDASGKTWQIHDVRETTVAVMIFTMLFSGLLAALRLAKRS
jgi:putative membrane protein